MQHIDWQARLNYSKWIQEAVKNSSDAWFCTNAQLSWDGYLIFPYCTQDFPAGCAGQQRQIPTFESAVTSAGSTGITLTAADDAKGSWVELIASTAFDAKALWIWVSVTSVADEPSSTLGPGPRPPRQW